MSDPHNILISSAGRRGALVQIWRSALRRLALRGEVLASDMSPCSAAFHLADRAFLVPPCTSPEFVPAMLELCRRERIAVVVPTIDTELPMLAGAAGTLGAAGTTVQISSSEVVDIAHDKSRLHAWLVERGFPTVRQHRIPDVLAGRSGLKAPVFVKPVRGSASMGTAVVRDLARLAHLDDDDYIVQSIAPGREYTVDVLVSRAGKCVSAVPRRRIETRAGEVSKGVTERNAPVAALAKRVAEALPGAFGVLNIQVFHDAATGECNVIEINARYGGGFPLTWEAGAPYPCWFLEELLGLPSTAADDGWTEGLVMLRYDTAVFVRAPEAGL